MYYSGANFHFPFSMYPTRLNFLEKENLFSCVKHSLRTDKLKHSHKSVDIQTTSTQHIINELPFSLLLKYDFVLLQTAILG